MTRSSIVKVAPATGQTLRFYAHNRIFIKPCRARQDLSSAEVKDVDLRSRARLGSYYKTAHATALSPARSILAAPPHPLFPRHALIDPR